MWLAAQTGDFLRRKVAPIPSEERDDFDVVLGAALTLLGLIIGFSFSMAVSRYDQRKNLEEEEANAIGTEYVRAQLMPADSSAKTRALLKKYLDLRIQYYTARNAESIRRARARNGY